MGREYLPGRAFPALFGYLRYTEYIGTFSPESYQESKTAVGWRDNWEQRLSFTFCIFVFPEEKMEIKTYRTYVRIHVRTSGFESDGIFTNFCQRKRQKT